MKSLNQWVEKADIIAKSGSNLVICNHCQRETEFVEYRKMLDDWLDEVQIEPPT